MTDITIKDPVVVPHKYRNRFLRDSGASNVTIGSAGGGSSVDLSPYLKKVDAESTYLQIQTFEELFEKVNVADEGEEARWTIKAKYDFWSIGGIAAYGYGGSTEAGGSVVEWNQLYDTEGSRVQIASIVIDGVETKVYAPTGGGVTGGVITFGGASGELTVRSGSTTNGDVNFAMNGKELQGSVYGLKGLAYKDGVAWNDLTTKATKSQLTDIIGDYYALKSHNHNSSYVSAVGWYGNKLRVTKNGTSTDTDVPYALKSENVAFVAPDKYSTGLSVYMAQTDAYEGVSDDYSVYCYPTGGTYVNGSTANEMGIRMYWSQGYFRDIFMSPNNGDIWHRAVKNYDAQDWRLLIDTGNISTYAETNLWYSFGQTYTHDYQKDDKGDYVLDSNGNKITIYPLYWKCIGYVKPNTDKTFVKIEAIVCGDCNYPSQMRLTIVANAYKGSSGWSLSASITSSGVAVMPSSWQPQICLTEDGYLWLNAGILWGTNIKYRLIDITDNAAFYSDCDAAEPTSKKPKITTIPTDGYTCLMNSGIRYQDYNTYYSNGSINQAQGWYDYNSTLNIGGAVDYNYALTAKGGIKLTNRNNEDIAIYAKNTLNKEVRFVAENSGCTVGLYAGRTVDGVTMRGIKNGNSWLLGTTGSNTFMLNGNVGVGTASPSYKLQVNGDADVDGNVYVKTAVVLENGSSSLNVGYGTRSKALNLYSDNSVCIRKESECWVKFDASAHKILIRNSDISGTEGTNYGAIEWDATNKAFKFYGNLYATGGISAYNALGSGNGTVSDLSVSNQLTAGKVVASEVKIGSGGNISNMEVYNPSSSAYYLDVTIGGQKYRISMSKVS